MKFKTISQKPVEFFYPEDKKMPLGDKAKFVVRALTWQYQRDMENMVTLDADTSRVVPMAGSIKELKLTKGVIGWENVQNEDGKDLKFSLEHLMSLSGDVKMWLMDKINSLSEMDKEEVENLK